MADDFLTNRDILEILSGRVKEYRLAARMSQREMAEKSDCVIVGRCADYVLSEYSPCIRVFLHAPLEERVKRAVEEYGVSSRNPQFTVIRKDKDRSSYYNYFTDKKWGKVQNYDIALSTSIGLEECADIIVKYVKTVIGKEE